MAVNNEELEKEIKEETNEAEKTEKAEGAAESAAEPEEKKAGSGTAIYSVCPHAGCVAACLVQHLAALALCALLGVGSYLHRLLVRRFKIRLIFLLHILRLFFRSLSAVDVVLYHLRAPVHNGGNGAEEELFQQPVEHEQVYDSPQYVPGIYIKHSRIIPFLTAGCAAAYFAGGQQFCLLSHKDDKDRYQQTVNSGSLCQCAAQQQRLVYIALSLRLSCYCVAGVRSSHAYTYTCA